MPSRFCSRSIRRRPARSCRQRGRTCGRGEPHLFEHPADGGEAHVCRQSWVRSPGKPACSRMQHQQAHSRQELSSSGNTRSAPSARGSDAISFAASDPNQMVRGPVFDGTEIAAVLARGGRDSNPRGPSLQLTRATPARSRAFSRSPEPHAPMELDGTVKCAAWAGWRAQCSRSARPRFSNAWRNSSWNTASILIGP